MNFFKYYSAGKDASVDSILAPLKYHALRYVSADQFNDPYDSKIFFETLDGKREDAFSDVINKHLRIASMSRNPSSPIMWSHYASHHAGYILEYELDSQFPYQKVEYEKLKPFYYSTQEMKSIILSKYPDISDSDVEVMMKKELQENEKFMNNLWAAIMTKHNDWVYEDEYRFIDVNPSGINDAHIDKPLETKRIRSIILGYRFDHEKLDDELRSIINSTYESLVVYKAEPSMEEYSMNIRPYSL
ncbi:TPA: DUF2971 domain-containing protein [Vibrio parahaemolyticus]|nr:DUF2971 domain-containing protein [Vibrio parahaemolyticus]HBH7862192.1 DUF2971 domain-containing protein [Vibrio parahaemolyticus]HBH7904660.1 DUF2971 domain-containing protein [Vibrio parahaemolyticus]